MSFFRRKGEKTKYAFLDADCIGRKCWAAGMYQHRSPMSCGGSRNTGSPDSPCCLNRAYHGCPDGPVGRREVPCDCDGSPHGTHIVTGVPEFDPELARKRKAEGWKLA